MEEMEELMPRTKAPAEPTVYVAISSGVVKIDGTLYRYSQGQTRVRAGHPLLKARPDKFAPLKLDYEIEQATAAPGERRGA
jgi:hypothetical protein